MDQRRGRMERAMASTGALLVWRRIHRRHVQWAVLAVVLSVVLHIVFILFFPGVAIYGLNRDMLETKARVPIQLQEVRTRPELSEAERRPARFRPEAARGAVAGDRAVESEASRQPVDEAEVEPRRVEAGVLIGEARTLVEPEAAVRPVWEPRQDIVSINRRFVRDDAVPLPRRYVAAIPRQARGAEIAMPADRSDIGSNVGVVAASELAENPSDFGWGRGRGGAGAARGGGVKTPEKVILDAPKPGIDEQKRVSMLKALEKYLKADVFVYRPALDSRYGYCRIEVKRRTSDLLPVLAKDLLLVQDASASITEQKLYYCREGLLKALELLGPEDRFNVVEFRDVSRRCFADWAAADPDNLQRAREFVGGMISKGDTDIFGSLKELLALPRKAGRPLVAMVVSDGVPTVGMTDRSQIIEAFSQANLGALSVFTLGTYAGANAYLLDLLSYRNRGDTFIVRSGRWDIPELIEARVREVSRPVLSDVRFRFTGPVWCEAYPALTSNLYLDRPLVLVGRYPRDARRLVFQATGRADDIECDMVFDIDLSQAAEGDKAIRMDWAWQKAYALIGEHSRTRKVDVMGELRQLRKDYGIRIPYRDELSR